MKTKLYFIGGLIFVAFAIFALIAGIFRMRQMGQAATWPTTEGVVIKSELMGIEVGRKGAMKANVHYAYTVGGQRYTGSIIRLGDMTPSRKSAQGAVLAKYPLNKKVTVYYDPKSPRQAVLAVSGWVGRMMMLAPAIVLFTIGALLINESRRLWKISNNLFAL